MKRIKSIFLIFLSVKLFAQPIPECCNKHRVVYIESPDTIFYLAPSGVTMPAFLTGTNSFSCFQLRNPGSGQDSIGNGQIKISFFRTQKPEISDKQQQLTITIENSHNLYKKGIDRNDELRIYVRIPKFFPGAFIIDANQLQEDMCVLECEVGRRIVTATLIDMTRYLDKK